MYQSPLFASRRWASLLVVGLLSVSLVACDDDDDDPVNNNTPTILEVVQANAEFDVLEAAVNRVEALRVELGSALNSYTVFAPRDAAFQSLLGVTSEQAAIEAINGLDPSVLSFILQNHVVLGQRTAATLSNGVVPTLANSGGLEGRLFVRVNSGTVRVSNATVVQADANARNGVVHVIDQVLAPADGSIVDAAVDNDDLNLLTTALTRAGLVPTFETAGPFTVFAPTDAAFIQFLGELNPAVTNESQATSFIQGLTDEQVNTVLIPVLTAHVLAGNTVAFAVDVPTTATNLATLNSNRQVSVQRNGSNVTVVGAGTTASNVVAADILTTNGVVHVIDRVIRTN